MKRTEKVRHPKAQARIDFIFLMLGGWTTYFFLKKNDSLYVTANDAPS
jgi:hypothetical protein